MSQLWQLISLAVSCLSYVFFFGGWKLYQKYGKNKLSLNISTVCITLEMLNCFFWFISRIFKLTYACNTFVSVPYRLDLFFSYLAFPFTFASGLFLIWFWLQLTSKKLYRGAFLHKAYYPAFGFAILQLVVDWVVAFLWITNIDSKTIFIITTAILSFLLIIAAAYFVTAFRVYLYSKTKGTAHRNMFLTITVKILISGIVMVLLSILSLIVSVLTADQIVVRTSFIYVTVYLISFRAYLVIDCFSTEKIKGSSKSSDKVNKSSSAEPMNTSGNPGNEVVATL